VPLKILLADDSMIAQSMGKKILSEAGYDVTTVSNGAAAIKKFPELQPDILLLDVYMPGYSGLEVTEKIRNSPATAHVPILLTVGKLEPFRPEEGMKAKADGVIVKPFEATDLIAVVDQLAQRVSARPPTPPAPPAPTPRMPEVAVTKPEVAGTKEEEGAKSQPFASPGGSEPGMGLQAPPEPADVAAPEEDLLQALAFKASEPVRPPEPRPVSVPPAALSPLLPAEVQVAVAALDLTSGELDRPTFMIPPQPVSGTPPQPRSPQVTTEFRPLEIRLEPALESAETEPQAGADETGGRVRFLASLEPMIAQPTAPVTPAPEIPLPQLPQSASPPDSMQMAAPPQEAVMVPGGAEQAVEQTNRATDELPEFALFSSVFGSAQDGQFEARLVDTMEAFDTAATVPEPRPVPPIARVTEPALPELATPQSIPDRSGASFEIDLQQLLGGEPMYESKPAMAEAAAVSAAAAPLSPPAETMPAVPAPPSIHPSEPHTSFDYDISRALQRGSAGQSAAQDGAQPLTKLDSHKEAVDAPTIDEEIVNLGVPEELPSHSLPAAESSAPVAPVLEAPATVKVPAEWASGPAEVIATAVPPKADVAKVPAEAVSVAGFAKEPDVSSATWVPMPTATKPPGPPPEPAVAAANEPVAEQIVDRVLQRLRPELVEEVKRLLQDPEA
jgi:CheY-like chemotaxis protein